MWNKKYLKKPAGTLALILAAALLAGCEKEASSQEPEAKAPAKTAEEPAFIPSGTCILAEEKQETVKVKAAADGSVQEITVETKLTCPDGSDDIKDYTNLSDIKNTKGDEEYVLADDGTLIWQNHGEDITYEGTSSEPLPVELDITYDLDGKEISPEELEGKSGAVKIRFDYTNNTVYEDVKVPFVALSFAMLSGDHFSNVEVENGDVMELDDDLIVYGIALPGLDECLSLEDVEATEEIDLPQFVEITADVMDFELDFTETIITSGLFEKIEDEDLDDLSDLKKKSKKLDQGVDKLIDGTDSLADGMADLKKYLRDYTDGVSSLNKGISELAGGLSELNKNKENMTAGISALAAQIEAMKPMLSEEDYNSLQALLTGMQGYVDAVDALEKATGQLKSGGSRLTAAGNSLVDGMDELIEGTGKLKDGLEKLGDQGITKLTKLLGTDLQKLVKEVRALKEAEMNYTSFAGCMEGQESSVSFFIETNN